jgi:hypothetical protein
MRKRRSFKSVCCLLFAVCYQLSPHVLLLRLRLDSLASTAFLFLPLSTGSTPLASTTAIICSYRRAISSFTTAFSAAAVATPFACPVAILHSVLRWFPPHLPTIELYRKPWETCLVERSNFERATSSYFTCVGTTVLSSKI